MSLFKTALLFVLGVNLLVPDLCFSDAHLSHDSGYSSNQDRLQTDQTHENDSASDRSCDHFCCRGADLFFTQTVAKPFMGVETVSLFLVSHWHLIRLDQPDRPPRA